MDFPIYLVYSAIAVSFYASFMGGANDFANSFGTSVGSRAITIRQAVMIAVVAELLGAVLVGGHVTNTIRKGILDPVSFANDPRLLMLGLWAALAGSGLFLQVATHFGMPVSTTHAIVGALVGFGIITQGLDGINWSTIFNIVMSWVVSPVGGGIVAYFVFRIIQSTVLRVDKPIRAARRVVPFFVGMTILVVAVSVMYKGLKNLGLDLSFREALLYSAILGLIGSTLALILLKRMSGGRRRVQLVKVEASFKFLQIFTAGYVAFAHGSNDVANSIGPLAGIWAIYKSGMVGLQSDVPFWILLLGGVGILAGLAVFGHRVIDTVGKKITRITPSRGFSAEFAAATVVLTFSKLGMPVSTTHTLVGAVIGVGLARGIGALDLRVVSKILTSWFVTIPLAAICSVAVFLILRAVV